MRRPSTVQSRAIVSDTSAARLVQWSSFLAAPTLLIVALNAVSSMARSPFEVLLGVLSSASVALLLVILGLVSFQPLEKTKS